MPKVCISQEAEITTTRPLIGKYLMGKYPKIRAECVMSSEFQYVQDLIDDHAVVIAISQSGESADVLQAVKDFHTNKRARQFFQ